MIGNGLLQFGNNWMILVDIKFIVFLWYVFE